MVGLFRLLRAIALVIGVSGCGDNVCEEAVSRLNQCKQTACGSTAPEVKFTGDCNDNAVIGAGETFAMKTWSERFVDCDIDPETCVCPGLETPDILGGCPNP